MHRRQFEVGEPGHDHGKNGVAQPEPAPIEISANQPLVGEPEDWKKDPVFLRPNRKDQNRRQRQCLFNGVTEPVVEQETCQNQPKGQQLENVCETPVNIRVIRAKGEKQNGKTGRVMGFRNTPQEEKNQSGVDRVQRP